MASSRSGLCNGRLLEIGAFLEIRDAGIQFLLACNRKDLHLFEKKQNYSPTEAKRAYDQLDQLVAEKTINPRQAGAYRRHVASRVQVTLKPSYTVQAARRAKTEIVNLTEAGTITMKSAAAYRAHITKRTVAA
jgi:hypothetical protein